MHLTIIEILLIAVALGVDAFSVAISVGVQSCLASQVARISASFGFFQFIMPVIGWYAGNTFISKIDRFRGYIAFALLLFIGIHMLMEALRKDHEKIECDRTTGWTLIGLSVATSIDALGVGLSIGALNGELWHTAIIIGVVAAIMTMMGMYLGKKLSEKFGKRMEIVGAVVLILLAFKMLTV